MSLIDNLEHIHKFNRNLEHRIAHHEYSPDTHLEFITAQNDSTVLNYNNVLVHSTINPEEEAIESYNMITNSSQNSIIVIIGLGLGYLFKRVYESTQSKIIVYEPIIDI